MSVDRIQLLRNVGQFDSVNVGAQFLLNRLALIYAENGRGKTTLASIFRSASTGDAQLVTDRHRLGAQHQPHIVLSRQGGPQLVFQNGAWSTTLPNIAVFDDHFIAQNVCAGVEIGTSHRQNLHELILGAQGVALNATLQAQVNRIEEHNRTLRVLSDEIPEQARRGMTVDTFCALVADANINDAIMDVEHNLAAAQSADAVRQAAEFSAFNLPSFDIQAISALLTRRLPDLEAAAAAAVHAHLARLGQEGAAWVGDGMQSIAGVSAGLDHDICPFCAQDLDGSQLLRHYQAYFSASYNELKRDIKQQIEALHHNHGELVSLNFEQSVRDAKQHHTFWSMFLQVPDVNFDTTELAHTWRIARTAVAEALSAKQAAPLENISLSETALAAIEAYETAKTEITVCLNSLLGCNTQIEQVKAGAATANLAVLTSELTRLRCIEARHSTAVAPHCVAYLAEKTAKIQTENLRDQARDALNHYRRNIFPAYQTLINRYLGHFNAAFRLDQVNPINTRAGSTCTYTVLINNAAVPQTADAGPAFRNTLSAGDRNALALAFFFASLEQDPQLAQKIVVIDDPMTSLDEHRALTTVQELRRLLSRVTQVIVLSHSKPFLCNLWEGASATERSAMRLIRTTAGSTFAAWDVRQDCITEHDRRHALVSRYLQAADPTIERQIASALRPILEAFARVAYPAAFPPGGLLGPFIGICEQRINTPTQILNQADITELRALLDYANMFHHDSNLAWETQTINDIALVNFAQRTLAFTRR
ncbi:AAA family ATPase [Alcaligenes phenolicus]|uniref:AAA family ATPase n=1 Tax=Alcaligenes phenolicus TaxID=232846 RepID=UPI002AA876EA|nr:AAA family ATPase [Alcaligenes phenolicus]